MVLQISEDNLIKISWGALAVSASTIIGFVFWLSALHSTALTNTQAIQRSNEVFIELNKNLSNIDKRLSSIEGYLKAKEHNNRGK